MSGTSSAEQIENLASEDAGVREAAAQQIHTEGVRLTDGALRAWRKDAELSILLLAAPAVVGVVVRPERFAKIRSVTGGPRLADVPAEQDAQEFEVHAGGATLDILTVREGARPGGAIARFLEKLGEGIQQVEFCVSDVDRATRILRERFGLAAVYPQTRPGADGTRVNFFLYATADGKKVLIELVEKPDDPGTD